MGMTLDEYLAEIDRWKQPVSDQTLALSVSALAQHDREARAWLETKLGRPLNEASWGSEKNILPKNISETPV